MKDTKTSDQNKETVPGCLLRKDERCGKCNECGWNQTEAQARKERIRAGGLDINEKGFRYLPIHRNTGEGGAGA